MNAFDDVKRVLAAVGALGLVALNDFRLLQALPSQPEPGNGRTHAITLRLMESSDQLYASLFDLATRYGLMALVVAACAWAIAETLPLGAKGAKAKTGRKA